MLRIPLRFRQPPVKHALQDNAPTSPMRANDWPTTVRSSVRYSFLRPTHMAYWGRKQREGCECQPSSEKNQDEVPLRYAELEDPLSNAPGRAVEALQRICAPDLIGIETMDSSDTADIRHVGEGEE